MNSVFVNSQYYRDIGKALIWYNIDGFSLGINRDPQRILIFNRLTSSLERRIYEYRVLSTR